ncbi:MAG: hypothetical protein NVS4B7_10430 [Ktedonobacteraceae bacterium]
MHTFQYCKNGSQEGRVARSYETKEGASKNMVGWSGWSIDFALYGWWSNDFVGIGCAI